MLDGRQLLRTHVGRTKQASLLLKVGLDAAHKVWLALVHANHQLNQRLLEPSADSVLHPNKVVLANNVVVKQGAYDLLSGFATLGFLALHVSGNSHRESWTKIPSVVSTHSSWVAILPRVTSTKLGRKSSRAKRFSAWCMESAIYTPAN
jgi:hypothetical protein